MTGGDTVGKRGELAHSPTADARFTGQSQAVMPRMHCYGRPPQPRPRSIPRPGLRQSWRRLAAGNKWNSIMRSRMSLRPITCRYHGPWLGPVADECLFASSILRLSTHALEHGVYQTTPLWQWSKVRPKSSRYAAWSSSLGDHGDLTLYLIHSDDTDMPGDGHVLQYDCMFAPPPRNLLASNAASTRAELMCELRDMHIFCRAFVPSIYLIVSAYPANCGNNPCSKRGRLGGQSALQILFRSRSHDPRAQRPLRNRSASAAAALVLITLLYYLIRHLLCEIEVERYYRCLPRHTHFVSGCPLKVHGYIACLTPVFLYNVLTPLAKR